MAVPLFNWVNGNANTPVDPADRGLAYGDGLFETMRYHCDRILQLENHITRLQRGCERLAIGYDASALEHYLEQAIVHLQQRAIDHACIKLILTRGVSTGCGVPAGYGAHHSEATVLVQANPVNALASISPPLSVGICTTRLSDQPRLAGLKHCNRLEQVLAAQEVTSSEWDNGLMMNARDEFICAVSANLFIYLDKQLITPDISSCGVEGTMKQMIIEKLAPALGLPVMVGRITHEDLYRADELFLSNAMIAVQSACLHDSATQQVGAVTTQLFRQYLNAVQTQY